MILEVTILNIKCGQSSALGSAFRHASWLRGLPGVLVLSCLTWNAATAGAEPSDASVREASCVASYRLDTSAGRLTNNMWNRQAVRAGSYRQCILSRGAEEAQEFGWSWSWPGDNNVLVSYPASVFGWKPWDGGTSNHPMLPVRIDRIRDLRLTFDLDTKATGRRILSTALWLTRAGSTSTNPDPSGISADVNIWMDEYDVTPSGSQLARVTIGGVEYELWNVPDMGDASAESGPRWNHIVYRATTKRAAGSLDLAGFLDDVVARGLVPATHYVSSIEVGNEIMSGTGETWIRALSLDVR